MHLPLAVRRKMSVVVDVDGVVVKVSNSRVVVALLLEHENRQVLQEAAALASASSKPSSSSSSSCLVGTTAASTAPLVASTTKLQVESKNQETTSFAQFYHNKVKRSNEIMVEPMTREHDREKKFNDRASILKKHYQGKLIKVAKANSSCEAMDESMDTMERHLVQWLKVATTKGNNPSDCDKKMEVASFTVALDTLHLTVLDLVRRSGIDTTSETKKTTGDNNKARDPRSWVEAALSEELYQCSQEFFKFIKDRMKILHVYNNINSSTPHVETMIELLEGMLNELHLRNMNVIAKIGENLPPASRTIKAITDLRKEVEKQLVPPPERSLPQSGAASGRSHLLPLLEQQARGCGTRGCSCCGRGINPLLAGRGRGGRAVILWRNQCASLGRGDGGVLSAIQARSASRSGRGSGGRRGGLLAAIQAHGGGRRGSGGEARSERLFELAKGMKTCKSGGGFGSQGDAQGLELLAKQ